MIMVGSEGRSFLQKQLKNAVLLHTGTSLCLYANPIDVVFYHASYYIKKKTINTAWEYHEFMNHGVFSFAEIEKQWTSSKENIE